MPQAIKNLFGEGKTYPDVYMLTIDESIDKRTPVYIQLKSNSPIPCYWIRNTENNCLFTPSEFSSTVLSPDTTTSSPSERSI